MPTLIGQRRTRLIKTDLVFSFVLTASKGQLILVSKTATFVDRLTAAKGQITLAGKAITIFAVPVSVVAPVVSGTTTVGSVLSCTTGTWTNSPTSYTYQWYRAVTSGGVPITDGNGNYIGVTISGATASTYALVTGDLGEFIFCDVLASNAAGPSLLVGSSNYVGLIDPASSAVTWNPADAGTGLTFANGDLDVSKTTTGWASVRATLGKSSGKRYFETAFPVGWNVNRGGLATADGNLANTCGSLGATASVSYWFSGNFLQEGGFTNHQTLNPSTWAGVPPVMGYAVDLDAGKIWLSEDGNWAAYRVGSDPVTGANEICSFTPPLTLFPTASLWANHDVTQRLIASSGFTYAPPTGFIAWDA